MGVRVSLLASGSAILIAGSGAASVLLFGLIAAPSKAFAQTELPPIDVIAPTPLSGARSPRPKAVASPVRGARTVRAPAPPGQAAALPTAGSGSPASADGNRDITLIDRDKVPSNTAGDERRRTSATTIRPISSMPVNRSLPGVSLGDQTGNPFQRDLDYRGFNASPVQGTPQGIAVYQNGVRINESWGDVVNWDFIPEKAIRSASRCFPTIPCSASMRSAARSASR